MTEARRSSRHTLLAIGALFIPGLGHVVLRRWRTGLVLASAGLLANALAKVLILFAAHPAALALVVIFAYLPSVVSLVLYLRAQRSQPAASPAPRVFALGFALASLLLAAQSQNLSRDHVAQAFRVPSISMEPTLLVGDYLYVDRRASSQDYRHGDLIVFQFPLDPRLRYIKRVIAIGGDQLEIRDRVVILNGQPLIEPYAFHIESLLLPGSLSRRDNLPAIRVPPGNLFVMGDGRESSDDSRFWGFVPESDVLGRASSTYFSLDPLKHQIRWQRIGRSMAQLEALARER